MASESQPPEGGPQTALDEDLRDAPPAPTEAPPRPARQPRTRKVSRRLALGVGSVVPGTPYRLQRWLGDGGMGAVFEAEHVDTERRMAVKVLHAQRQKLQWVVDGFRNEARASARIGSPHIVDIYDFKELADGRLLIAMEFLDGPTLHEALDEPLPWPRLVSITRQICKGLTAAHEAGIVHRDIKPENIILIERDRRPDFVKLLDFGVALFIHDGHAARMSGTAQYMAPESTSGVSDARADIYSVGCLVYALIVGEPPFEGDTPSDILDKQRVQQPLAPSRHAQRSVPESLDALVLRCLAKDPAARFQSMDELEAALCELQIEQGWVTPWDDLPAPQVDPERRARIEAGLAALSRPSAPGPGWTRLLLAGVLAAAAVVIAVLAWPRPDAPVVDDALQRHAQAAQRAAARFYFVYPARNNPHGSTAYRELLALEALDTEPARKRGSELREEFATTLVRLGDRYWDYEGARPFAYEYYASALVFVEDDHARARTGLTAAGLERLRTRATSADFTDLELLASEPLVALAETDAQARVEQLATLRDAALPASVAASLDRVLEHPDNRELAVAHAAHLPRSDARATAPVDEDRDLATDDGSTSADEGSTTGAAEDSTTGAPDEPPAPSHDEPSPPTRPKRDPKAARTLVQQAVSAKASGNRSRAEALFNQALEADSRNLDALDGLASLAFHTARYGESARRLERAVKLGPRKASRWLALGDAYFKTLRYSDARKAYQRALDLGSREATARLNKLENKLGKSGGG